MVCTVRHDECETKAEELMKRIKYWRYYEDDLKECEDKGGYKGRGYVQEISRLMKIFEDRWWSLSWKASKPTYFQKIWWRWFQIQMDKYTLQEEYTSHILKRMKLSNLKGADLFQVKENNCNIIVN